MRSLIVVAAALLAVSTARVLPQKAAKKEDEPSKAVAYNYAVDVSVAVSSYQFGRLRSSSGFSTAFVRVYASTSNGQVDNNAQSNLRNAYSQGVGTEIYVQPAPQSYKSGQTQFTEAYNALQGWGITVKAIWLKVTGPIDWNSSQQSNINFINSFVQAAQRYGLTAGIYTNWYDWKQITSGSSSFSNVRLWYWNVLGDGAYAETYPEFTDFRSFGGWNSAVVKSYGQAEYKQGVLVNVLSYPAGNANAFRNAKAPSLKSVVDKKDHKEEIVVGDVFA